jgi:DNA repair exonuclease SbcCD ATPase subunit
LGYSSSHSGGGMDTTGGGMDLPQGFVDEPAHYKVFGRARNPQQQQLHHHKKTNHQTSWILPFGILMVIVLIAGYSLMAYHEQALMDHLKQDVKLEEEALSREFEEKYANLQDENQRLQSQIKEAIELKRQNEELVEESNHNRSLRQNYQKQIRQLTEYKQKIQENIQLMSKAILLEK